MTYRTRFAPSPTGYLHLGHAYSALVGQDRARRHAGEFRMRIEDIDTTRSRAEYERAIFEDLAWLGLSWSEPVMRQSGRRAAYDAALSHLTTLGVCFPCRCTRRDIRAAATAPQEGATSPVYPGTCRGRAMADATETDAIRLDLRQALRLTRHRLAFEEDGPLEQGRREVDGETLIARTGDIVLARRDIGTSYNLSVVVDDAAEGITEVVRGVDLFEETPVQRLLQELLGLPVPRYWHHDLVRDAAGRRLAKRDDARALRTYREAGRTPGEVREELGFARELPSELERPSRPKG